MSDTPKTMTNRKRAKDGIRRRHARRQGKMSPKAQVRFVIVFLTIALALIAIAIRALYEQRIAIPYLSHKVPWHEFTGLTLFFPVSVLLLLSTCLLSLAQLAADCNKQHDSRLLAGTCLYSFFAALLLHWLSLFFGVPLE